MKKSFQTIDIKAKEWFDKVNGNSYFSCSVTFDYGLPTQKTFICPFQYGYGSRYEQAAMEVVSGEFPEMPATFWEMRDKKVIIRSHKVENCKKRELFNPTQKEIERARKAGKPIYPYFQAE